MSRLLGLIRALLPRLESPQDRDEAFLALAVDHCDLERRIRAIDARGRASDTGLATALW